MSTFTGGAPPAVSPEPRDGDGPDHRVRDDLGGSTADTGSSWLTEEIQRLVAAKSAGSGGRHARRGGVVSAGSSTDANTSGYVPRHSTAQGAVEPGGRPGPARQPGGRPRRDEILGEAAAPPAAWSGPQQPRRLPQDRRPETGIGNPSLPTPPLRPAPPSGAAAARLLAPPPSAGGLPVPPAPPRSPSNVPPARPLFTPPATGSPSFGSPSFGSPSFGSPSFGSPTMEPSLTPRARPAGAAPHRYADGPSVGPGNEASDAAVVDEVLWSATAPPMPAVPVAVPRQRAPDADLFPVSRPNTAEIDGSTKRVRVVLAERKGAARPVRTVVDVQEGTPVGELLRSNLIGSQLSVALRFAIGAGLTLGMLPLLFALFPEIGRIEVLGLRLPWLVLGVLVYPFLLGLGWWHTRTAERVELNFADHVQD